MRVGERVIKAFGQQLPKWKEDIGEIKGMYKDVADFVGFS